MFTKGYNVLAGMTAMMLMAVANAGTGGAGGHANAGPMMGHATIIDRAAAGLPHTPPTQMSFNLQYLQLQNAMQNENREFTMVSKIMKTKQGMAKNTIGNIR